MTPEQVQAKLDAIEGMMKTGDWEYAHQAEDDLHQAVLRAIADGTCTDVEKCARLAMTTKLHDFPRWYA